MYARANGLLVLQMDYPMMASLRTKRQYYSKPDQKAADNLLEIQSPFFIAESIIILVILDLWKLYDFNKEDTLGNKVSEKFYNLRVNTSVPKPQMASRKNEGEYK